MSSRFQIVGQSTWIKMSLWALLFALLLALASNAFGSQIAIVSSPAAVVFADIDLSAPIGTIKMGKEIKVGSVARKNGTVLPIIVNDKIAYIQVKDVHLQEFKMENIKKISEHKYFDVNEQKLPDNIKENNHVSLAIHKFDSGSDWEKFSKDLGRSSNSDVTGYLLLFEHRPKTRNYHWGFGLGYYTISEPTFYFKTLTLEGLIHYLPVQTAAVTLDLGGGLMFSGDARVNISGAEQESRGSLWGYQFSAQAKLFPYSKLSFLGGVEYRKMIFQGLNKVQDPNSTATRELKTIGGTGIYLGLAYKF